MGRENQYSKPVTSLNFAFPSSSEESFLRSSLRSGLLSHSSSFSWLLKWKTTTYSLLCEPPDSITVTPRSGSIERAAPPTSQSHFSVLLLGSGSYLTSDHIRNRTPYGPFHVTHLAAPLLFSLRFHRSPLGAQQSYFHLDRFSCQKPDRDNQRSTVHALACRTSRFARLRRSLIDVQHSKKRGPGL